MLNTNKHLDRASLQYNMGDITGNMSEERVLELAKQHQPEIVVTDVMMPRMDGYALCRELRKEFDKKLVIVLVTARSGVEAVVEGLDVGADEYVTKPFQLGALLGQIRALIGEA